MVGRSLASAFVGQKGRGGLAKKSGAPSWSRRDEVARKALRLSTNAVLYLSAAGSSRSAESRPRDGAVGLRHSVKRVRTCYGRSMSVTGTCH